MRLIAKYIATTIASISLAFAAILQTTLLDAQNKTYSLCTIKIKKGLDSVPDLEASEINVAQKVAMVKFDSAKANTAALMKATTNAGFPAMVHK